MGAVCSCVNNNKNKNPKTTVCLFRKEDRLISATLAFPRTGLNISRMLASFFFCLRKILNTDFFLRSNADSVFAHPRRCESARRGASINFLLRATLLTWRNEFQRLPLRRCSGCPSFLPADSSGALRSAEGLFESMTLRRADVTSHRGRARSSRNVSASSVCIAIYGSARYSVKLIVMSKLY